MKDKLVVGIITTTHGLHGEIKIKSCSGESEHLSKLSGLLYIDEIDRIQTRHKQELAELIKLLSDSGSDFKILVVGIANTAYELTGTHPSVQRCLKETLLRGMSDLELKKIVIEGAKKANIRFDDKVVNAIVNLSSGYAHFTHLLALKCCEEAIANDQKTIKMFDLEVAMDLAVEIFELTERLPSIISIFANPYCLEKFGPGNEILRFTQNDRHSTRWFC